MRGNEISTETRAMAIGMHKAKKSYAEIARELGLSKEAVRSIISRYEMYGTVEICP